MKLGTRFDAHRRERLKKIITLSGTALATILAALLTLFVWRWLSSFSEDEFREYIRSFGAASWFVLLCLQFLQVFVALIPGELLESAAGYAFGALWGTLICYLGITAASALIFALTRRFGIRLIELFVPRGKIMELRFINTERKRHRLIFLLFFIPGTPKDLLTYFAALTDIKLGTFLALTLIARIPSMLSSTLGGHLLGEKNYVGAVLLYGITGIVSLLGILIYNRIIKMRNTR